MSKKIIIILLIIILAITVGAIVYYVAFKNYTSTSNQANNLNPQNLEEGQLTEKILTKEEQDIQIKKDYPLIIKGVISFFDKGKEMKATIKADDGKEYILWPPQPASIYESFGVKNSQKVEVQSRLNNEGNLEWALLKPIQND